MSNRLFISFSGGETSAYMTQWLLNNKANLYDDIKVVFANTGQENEETLEFVQKCDEHFGFGVIWVEAEVDPRPRKGTKHKIVDFNSACRQGSPFEEVIKKYGLPNQAWPHCTRELKLQPMTSYLRSCGWKKGSYDTAIGIRVDEIDRVSPKRKEFRFIYPLVSDHPMTKPEINAYWDSMPFRLNLKGYEGNCKWCWKKSLRKHLHLIKEHPDWYDFPEKMEQMYGLAGYNIDGTPRTLFRQNKSTKDLRELAITLKIDPPEDDSRVYETQMGLELDLSYGCSESCEIDFEDNTQ